MSWMYYCPRESRIDVNAAQLFEQYLKSFAELKALYEKAVQTKSEFLKTF